MSDTTEIEDIYPLSPMQGGMLFHTLLSPQEGFYIEQSGWSIRGRLDEDAFDRAWQTVIDRHPALRTTFVWEDVNQPLQIVHRASNQFRQLNITHDDWQTLNPAAQDACLNDLLEEDRRRGYDPAELPLMRLFLLRTGEDAYQFVWSHHHLLLDGWSLPIIFRDVLICYQAYSEGRTPLFPLVQPFRNYISWLQKQDMRQAEAFWREELRGFTAPTHLRINELPHQAGKKNGYTLRTDQLSSELTACLNDLAHRLQITLNTVVQGAWAALLACYSGETDVLFGATVSGRPPDLAGSAEMVGLLINTLPVRVQVPAEIPTSAWLIRLQQKQAALRQYEYAPLADIQTWSAVARDQPLFDTLLVFENYPTGPGQIQAQSGLQIKSVQSFTRTNYPLTIAFSPGKRMGVVLAYDAGRLSSGSIDRLFGHLKTILQAMAASPDLPPARLPLLAPEERRRMLVDWNRTQAAYDDQLCAHHLFEQAAARHPNALAVCLEMGELTYAELNARANQLAHLLIDYGVVQETIVGICLDRSPEMIVAILAVLKAGGAYLPLDPEFPLKRLSFMLEDSQASWLITASQVIDVNELQFKGGVFFLDRDAHDVSGYPQNNPVTPVGPDNRAYVIYTSGSTGLPKGVQLLHRGLSSLKTFWVKDLAVGPGERVLQFFTVSFDAAVFDIFMALTTGAALQLAPQEATTSLELLHDLIQRNAVTIAVFPPTILRALSPDGLDKLRMVISAGEACTSEIPARWKHGRRFINAYGPTENTIASTWYEVSDLQPAAPDIPIGRPIPNTRAYILDRHLQPLPVGVPGELFLGGLALSPGYLNRPELTAKAFIPNPLPEEPGDRLYRTGDLATFLPDGAIRFLGRIDHQVKLRGFRIELGEIESVLTGHPAIQDCALVKHGQGDDARLIAYVVARPGSGPPAIGDLRQYLKGRLPAYMLPAAFIFLDLLPLSPSGKVDRKALPAPETLGAQTEIGAKGSTSPVESALLDLASQVLNGKILSLQDDFFELGGHSLLATQLASRIKSLFQVDLPLKTVFEAKSLGELAQWIQGELRASTWFKLPPIRITSQENPPLSFAQQRLWFIEQLAPQNLFYNIPLAIHITGAIDLSLLRQSLEAIVERHAVLRTSFPTANNKPVQRIDTHARIQLALVDLTGMPEDERWQMALQHGREEIRRPFDLAAGPLFRAKALQLAENDCILILTMHHIVSDGWSMSIFVREMINIYTKLRTGQAPALPRMPIQYADYAVWQREWLQGAVLENQLAYWKKQLAGLPPMLELPLDKPRPPVQSWEGNIIPFEIHDDLAARLRALSRDEGATLYMTLLAAFQVLLYRYSGQTDFAVGAPIANRCHPETEGLIGFFVNTLVLRANLNDNPTFSDVLERVKEMTLGAYSHQDLPFETLVEALQPQRDLSHTPLFQVMFAMDVALPEIIHSGDMTVSGLDLHAGTASFDLTISMRETSSGLSGYIEYNTDLFLETTIHRLIGHLETILRSAVENPAASIQRMAVLTPAERRAILDEWNRTSCPIPTNCTAHQLFERQAALHPDTPALRYAGQDISYGELNRRANQIAYHLISLGLPPETPVAISTLRSPEMVAAILGVMKAGCAYVPLDPNYPHDRLAFMLEDSGAPILLTQSELLEQLLVGLPFVNKDGETIEVYRLDAGGLETDHRPGDNPDRAVAPHNLAYMIYTSGSTGKPKGALLQHAGLVNLASAQRDIFGISAADRILQFSPMSFDASVWEIFMALANGACLCLAPIEEISSPVSLPELLAREAITIITLPPTMLRTMSVPYLPSLRTIIAAGEACTPEIVAAWAPNRELYNAYGPTETTVCASIYRCDSARQETPPIGKPIANTRLYILDPNLQPVPIGVPGELHIGGVSLARGYHNRPDLTQQRFIPDPFSPRPGERLYKSGDLVRYRPDGNIEFLGRIDSQVKLRGFRIELGEIETALTAHLSIQAAAVSLCEAPPGECRLVAYLIPRGEERPSGQELRAHLRRTLPEYMLPAVFVYLEQLPILPNGKVDRAALPPPDTDRSSLGNDYVAPHNEVERQLACIAAELLNLDHVGVQDNFFDLGGHSLLATQFISRVRTELEIELPLKDLFEFPTVAGLAEKIQAAIRQDTVSIKPPEIKPLSRGSYRVRKADLAGSNQDE